MQFIGVDICIEATLPQSYRLRHGVLIEWTLDTRRLEKKGGVPPSLYKSKHFRVPWEENIK